MSGSQSANFSRVYNAVQSVPRGYCASPTHFSLRALPPQRTGKEASQHQVRVCFCSTSQREDFRPCSIYYVDIEDIDAEGDVKEEVSWKPLLDQMDVSRGSGSLADELLKERMRAYTEGISDYGLTTSAPTQLLYTFGGRFLAAVPDILQEKPPYQSIVRNLPMGCLMPEMCPLERNLVCFSDGANLFVCHLGQQSEVNAVCQLSHASSPGVTAGFPTYIMQEEFDRYKGFWWRPVSGPDGEFSVLYEENNESAVPILKLPDFSGEQQDPSEPDSSTAGMFRFPRPGQNNSISNLKLVRFKVKENSILKDSVSAAELTQPLMRLLPEYEYLVRCGWTACGKYVWCHLLNRHQTKASLFAIPMESFTTNNTDTGVASRVVHLLTRDCHDTTWITIDDYFHIFATESTTEQRVTSVEFLLASEHQDHRHIYYVKRQWAIPSPGDTSKDVIYSSGMAFHAVTQGDWEVTSETPMLDEKRSLVYFTARKEHPLMDHVYVQNYRHPQVVPVLLTPQTSFSYNMHLDVDTSKMVLTYSNHSSTGGVDVMSIQIPPQQQQSTQTQQRDLLDLHLIKLSHCATLHHLVPHSEIYYNFDAPSLEQFEFEEENGTKFTLYGLLFIPQREPPSDRGHPCLHYIYGGPGVQMIGGEYPRHIYQFAYQFIAQGYAVFVCDGPGPKSRGNHFASVIKYKMGCIELHYQLQFIQHVALTKPIDLSRLAIHGWSYGGYMTLMAMAHFKEHYRVGVAGGSVTQWELYDTGYTERYMGLPDEQVEAYRNGNVLKSAHLLPDERHRLLLIHGGMDENVHIFHITSLIECMDTLHKPYDLLLYPKGRHRIRMRDHLVASIVAYLEENL